MIADLKPYADYKESGLPWLGHVPGHWKAIKLKYAFRRIVGGSTPASGNPRYWNGDVTWVTPADVSRSERLRRSIRQISRAGMLSCSTEMVPRGSIVLTSRAPVGNVAIAEVDLCTNQGCKALIPDTAVMVPMFGFWMLSVLKGEIQSLSTGTTFSEVSTSRLGGCFGVLPPPSEQAAIVRFLDWANGRLERAIRAKRKVIALLNEQKQASIHRAVTRGLDSSVPLKPSGIPWLGDVPQRWEVLPLGRLMVERNEKNDPIKTSDILSLSLHDGVIPYADKRPGGNKAKEDLTAYKLAYPGDIVLNSMNVVVGSVGLSKYFGAVSPVYYLLRPRHSDDLVEYCDAIFHDRSFQSSLFGLGNGIMVIHSKATGKLNTIRMRIPIGKLNRVDVPHPGHEEQVAIVGYLAQAKASFDRVMGTARREVELIQEYRTRLVADVVTGKLDVREAAARLPEEAPPESAEDDADLSDEAVAAGEEAAA